MKGLAWISFVGAIIAGAGLAATSAGLVQILAVIAALVVLAMDIAKDRTPNQSAVIVAVVLPSLIVGMNGKLADTIDRWLSELWANVQGPLGEWAGTPSAFGVAAVVVTVSVLISRRAMPKTSMGR